jgi:hypothetical protein
VRPYSMSHGRRDARDPGDISAFPAVKRAVARHTRTLRGRGGMRAISTCPQLKCTRCFFAQRWATCYNEIAMMVAWC